MKKRIVVTGLGVVSSIGTGRDLFWQNLLKGVSGISPVTSFDTSKHATHIGGEVKNFRPQDFMDKRKIKFIGRASQMTIAATRLALEDAKLNSEIMRNAKTSVCIGTTVGEMSSFEEADHEWIRSGGDHVNRLAIFKSLSSNIPANVAIEFGFTGRNRIFTTACAAGNYAIGYGYDLLRSGETDFAITGGAEAFSWMVFTGFNRLGAVAGEKCQPFDKNRKGMVPGEGAAVLILETLENALRRQSPIYAEILGYGLSCDASHMTNTQMDGVARCMHNALDEAGVSCDSVDSISSHGTGTKHNDKTEVAAIKSVFGNRNIPVNSIKSMLGHTMGAASAIEALACCLSVKNDILPPTINYETPDPECDIDCVPNVAREHKTNIILNNGFAFGGNNCCLVVKKI